MRTGKKAMIAAGVGLLVVGGVSTYVLARPMSTIVRAEPYTIASASPAQLEEVGGLRIFFGHQSVGQNILDATPAVFETVGVPPPGILELQAANGLSGPMIVHSLVGRNGHPLEKIEDFAAILRAGMAQAIDVALLKFCYLDVTEGTDVDALFAAYREALADLERDYPDVTFIHVTVPLQTEFGGPLQRAKRRIKDILGRDDMYIPAHNVAREEFNRLVRAEYAATGRLFDIAALQSTDSDGLRRVHTHSGSEYFVMEEVNASDPGHLNAEGARSAASALYSTIADTVD